MRKIEFNYKTGFPDTTKKGIKGFFHTFGQESFASEGNVEAKVVAIVEDEDGKVYKVNPVDVRFLDKLS